MRWRRELLLFGAAYLLYNAGRGITSGQTDLAIANANWVIDAQGGTGFERSVQDALGGLWMTLLSHIYLAAQIVVLPGVLVATYRWAPKLYPRLRDTVIATWMLSLPIYALFPVAPPRLAGLGMTDAVSETSAVALAGHSTWFYNPIAAVPSLHCGFAMAISVALAAATKRRWLQVLALSWGPIVALSTVATANHYVFDVAAGLAVTAVGYVVALRPRVRLRLARREQQLAVAT
jgi:membrane-associated phospholipid phosphatase